MPALEHESSLEDGHGIHHLIYLDEELDELIGRGGLGLAVAPSYAGEALEGYEGKQELSPSLDRKLFCPRRSSCCPA